jgi:hypothetical protein
MSTAAMCRHRRTRCRGNLRPFSFSTIDLFTKHNRPQVGSLLHPLTAGMHVRSQAPFCSYVVRRAGRQIHAPGRLAQRPQLQHAHVAGR